MKRYVIVGLGNFGSAAAELLFARGHEVLVVDVNEQQVDRMAVSATRSAVGDGRDLTTLRRLGAENADAGVVSTGDDIAASILATLALKDAGVGDLYVKVISRDHARVMEKLGVTETIFPERETGQALAKRMMGRAVLNFAALAPDFSIQEMAVPEAWERKALRDLDVRRNFGVNIVGIHDVLTDQVAAPEADTVLNESDTLYVAGRNSDLEKLAQL
ncbi:MAG: potassium channel family protein [Phycisphaerae bacterium]